MQRDGTRQAGRCYCCGEVAHWNCIAENKRNTLDFWGAFFCDEEQERLEREFPEDFYFIKVEKQLWAFFVLQWRTT
jgi:hypothetical protein